MRKGFVGRREVPGEHPTWHPGLCCRRVLFEHRSGGVSGAGVRLVGCSPSTARPVRLVGCSPSTARPVRLVGCSPSTARPACLPGTPGGLESALTSGVFEDSSPRRQGPSRSKNDRVCLRDRTSMPNYRRYRVPGGTYFFTVVTQGRARILTTSEARASLCAAYAECRRRWPFRVDGIVLLPEHLHAIWSLPRGDDDYARRWAFIKKEFIRDWLATGGTEQVVSSARRGRNRRGVWQPRFWEHLIRDDDDFGRHLDYIHYNPVKHGLVDSPKDWPYSSFHRWVGRGAYDPDWGCGDPATLSRRFLGLERTVGE